MGNSARRRKRAGATVIRLRGLGHQFAKDYPAAIDATREAIGLCRSLSPESRDVASVLNDLGVSQRLLGRYDEAESTLRDVPADLHQWLKQQAGAHRRSLNQEVILQLDALRGGTVSAADAGQRLARIRVIAERSAGLPVLDARPEAEILGLGTDGLPG